jgi:hypothetical protein
MKALREILAVLEGIATIWAVAFIAGAALGFVILGAKLVGGLLP